MGTRSGDIDPAIISYLTERENFTAEQISQLLNRESGLLGMAGINSGDIRDILLACKDDNKRAMGAVDTFVYRIQKYIGAYAAILNRLDALVFTAGIGENSPEIRNLVCEGLKSEEGLGVVIDPQKIEVAGPGTGRFKLMAAGLKS